MRKTIFSLLVTLFSIHIALGAIDNDDQILLVIDGQEITKEEFIRIYTKNNQDAAFDQASLDEYMKLFVNFKLKVMEAEALGMDTVSSFIKELKGYRTQLEKPYFADESTDEELIKEAYERMKRNVRASHILIECDENSLPKDTLKAYNKAKEVLAKLKRGGDFTKLAKQYSDDKSAQYNGGDLGYFTAFNMVYEFESAVYNTPVGEYANITRSKFGYHVIKVIDNIPDQGRVKVAHIMRSVPKESTDEKDKEELDYIKAVYDSVMSGEPFGKMAYRHSTDRGTSRKGGELKFFGVGAMVPEFEKAAFALDTVGQISDPVRTSYGYHIIKLLKRDSLYPFEEMEPIIKRKISKDIRAERGKQNVLAKLKKEYNVVENKAGVEVFYTAIDSTIYKGKWDGSGFKGGDEVILTIADTIKYTQNDFAKFITNDKKRRSMKAFILVVNEDFERFVDESIMEFEKSRLEEKYPDFKHLVKEYHDGILLFNLTDEMVWSKAVEDTVGLESFYEKNKNNYMWGDRVEATVYTFNNKELEKKIAALAKKIGKKNLNIDESVNAFLAKETVKDSTLTLKAIKAKYSKGDDDLIDGIDWEPGLKTLIERDNEFKLVFVDRKIEPEPKQLDEARGLITADYQTYLEELWLNELREKYTIEIKEEVFNSMVK